MADAVAAAETVLVAVPGSAVVDVLTAAGGVDGKVIIDAANMMGKDRLSLSQLAGSFPRARWVRAFNTLQARVLAEENHRQPRWVLFLSGDERAKPAVAQLITDAGFEPADLGGIEDSQFQEPGSALWNTTLEAGDAHALADRVRAGDAAAADPLTAPFEKLRDHAPDDPAFFFERLSRAVFQAGISWRVVAAKWDAIREAFHGFDPGKVAAMGPADIKQIEADAQVIRNNAKIEATVQNARALLAIVGTYGSVRAYLASFPDARSAAADLHHRFRFLGDAGVWRLLTSAARDLG
ncbi:MAG: DNA-3-methyladenine glycosylase I [Actinobacteria bacterium]|nr:DNA-3-methyladenine glycosylase I [Actinomycetota bacterium]